MIREILDSDTINNGFRLKYNETIKEIFTSCVDLGTGVIRFIKYGGGKIEVSLKNSFYTKSEVVAKIDEKVRFGEVALNEGENTVNFSTILPIGATWIFTGQPYCFDSEGIIGFTIVSKSNTGFVVMVAGPCTLNYQIRQTS